MTDTPERQALTAIAHLGDDDYGRAAAAVQPLFAAALEYARQGLEAGASSPGPSSPIEARIGRRPAGPEVNDVARRLFPDIAVEAEDWPPTAGEVLAEQEGQL